MSKIKTRDKARQLYIDSNGEKPLVDIANELNKPPGTVRGWKSKDKWDDELKKKNGTFQYKSERSTKDNVSVTHHEDKAKANVKKAVMRNKELTEKQQLFCMYYLKYFNATKAYQKAYQCSYATADANGSRLLGDARVKGEIDRLKEERAKAIQLDTNIIFQKYIDIAFADITDYLEFGKVEVPVIDSETGGPMKDEEGNILTRFVNYVELNNSKELDGTIVSEVTQGKDGVKIKLQDKMKALEWLANNIPSTGSLDTKEELENELLKERVKREQLQTRLLELELDNMTGEDADTEAIEEWLSKANPNAANIKDLFGDEDD